MRVLYLQSVLEEHLVDKTFTGVVKWLTISKTIICIEFYEDGIVHNANGPAIIMPNCATRYFIYGKEHSKEVWFEKLTTEEKVNILLDPENLFYNKLFDFDEFSARYPPEDMRWNLKDWYPKLRT